MLIIFRCMEEKNEHISQLQKLILINNWKLLMNLKLSFCIKHEIIIDSTYHVLLRLLQHLLYGI